MSTSVHSATEASTQRRPNLPARLHHNAYVTHDQEATRHFYEDIIGMPLIATWTEADHLFGKERVYCHTFFALADGSALAFFQFADKNDQEEFAPSLTPSPFRHIALLVDEATQDGIQARLAASDHPADTTYVLEHGYCRSLYVTDPNGLLLEFTLDHPDIERINAVRLASAHSDLNRWLSGDHSSNNTYRDYEA